MPAVEEPIANHHHHGGGGQQPVVREKKAACYFLCSNISPILRLIFCTG